MLSCLPNAKIQIILDLIHFALGFYTILAKQPIFRRKIWKYRCFSLTLQR